jgi:hypothetical protein
VASNTNETWVKREQRRAKMGRARKAHNRIHGTTPAFPIHTPEVDANAPAAQVSPKSA